MASHFASWGSSGRGAWFLPKKNNKALALLK
jgi:hypothetical protein